MTNEVKQGEVLRRVCAIQDGDALGSSLDIAMGLGAALSVAQRAAESLPESLRGLALVPVQAIQAMIDRERSTMTAEMAQIVARDTTFIQDGFCPTGAEKIGGKWAIVCQTLSA